MDDTSLKRAKPALVRAWFDTVLNPLIRGLGTEREFLEQGNLTWRSDGQRFAALAPVRDYIVPDAWPNLDQFLSIHGDLRDLLDRHDSALCALHERTANLHATLKADQKLVRMLDSGGGEGAAGLAPYIAEYIVNNAEKLPDYYTTAPLWNKISPQFLALRADDGLRSLVDAVDMARRDLLVAVNDLLDATAKLRRELSFELDVPIHQPVAS
jgi:hypothetical protein